MLLQWFQLAHKAGNWCLGLIMKLCVSMVRTGYWWWLELNRSIVVWLLEYGIWTMNIFNISFVGELETCIPQISITLDINVLNTASFLRLLIIVSRSRSCPRAVYFPFLTCYNNLYNVLCPISVYIIRRDNGRWLNNLQMYSYLE